MIHFDGFSLLLVVAFFSLGHAIGWRRSRAEMRSALANDAAVIAEASRD